MGAITSLIKGLLPRSQGAFRGSRGPAASGNEKAFLEFARASHAVSVAWSLVLAWSVRFPIRYLIPVFPLIFRTQAATTTHFRTPSRAPLWSRAAG